MFLCTKYVLFFTSQYVISPLKCRKQAPTNAADPSQGNKQKKQKKVTTTKKKKTPIKKKLKKATADPPTTVVSSLRRLVYED